MSDIWKRAARKCRQQFLVRGCPWKLLDLHADVRMRVLEVEQELADNFALASHGPKSEHRRFA